MAEGKCNKCGEHKDLVLAGCVCGSCSDALDKQWARSTATDWVLITDFVSEHQRQAEQKQAAALQTLKAIIAKASGQSETGAAVVARVTEVKPRRHLYRKTTYTQMKMRWANSEPPDTLTVDHYYLGPVPAEEIARSKSSPWHRRSPCPLIRPANPDEIADHKEALRFEVISDSFEKWGLDVEGRPLDSRCDDATKERALQSASEEIDIRFEELGLAYSAAELRELTGNGLDRTEGSSRALRAVSNQSVQPERKVNRARGLSQVAGMMDLKEQLMHEVIGPFKNPELYRRYRVSLPNGILFYGPPGCGKTYIARSLAEELGWSFQYCRPSDVASPYIHDTVSKIRAVFSAATEKAPSIVFIDEFEAFVPARSELGGHQQYKAEEVNEFLANLEGCAERRILVIAATNEPEKIDPAVRRSGRFDKLIFIAPPDSEARRAMLEFHLRDRPVDASLDTAGIATALDGYSASDIKLLVDEASRTALRRTETISAGTILAALGRVPASITATDVQRYSTFRARG